LHSQDRFVRGKLTVRVEFLTPCDRDSRIGQGGRALRGITQANHQY
jgi:hypothetical protein